MASSLSYSIALNLLYQQPLDYSMSLAQFACYAGLAAFAASLCYQGYRMKLNNDVLTFERSLPSQPMTDEQRAELRRLCEQADRFNTHRIGAAFDD
jgi:hypothetical protein